MVRAMTYFLLNILTLRKSILISPLCESRLLYLLLHFMTCNNKNKLYLILRIILYMIIFISVNSITYDHRMFIEYTSLFKKIITVLYYLNLIYDISLCIWNTIIYFTFQNSRHEYLNRGTNLWKQYSINSVH